ncbi:hypothetical protein PHA8399_02429 [Leisingera aquaemixtae]|uniref:Uncharacterized protein n=1 Tax=Leisingera aquaemixtae TaxID=1396826 RepID=A0A0P1HAG2_9RHOB|nr:hypothetical protein PHA8399_02429 [Leisingera aquaemixtae]
MSSTNGDHLKEYYAAFDDDNIREIARVKLATNSESNRGTVLIQASLLEKRLKDLAEASLNDTKETRELFADRGSRPS